MTLITKAALRSSSASAARTFVSHMAYFAAGFLMACLWIHHESQMIEQTQMRRKLLPENVVAKPITYADGFVPPPPRNQVSVFSDQNTSSQSPQQAATTRAEQHGQRDFFQIATQFGTDKVRGFKLLPNCVQHGKCSRPEAVNLGCKVTGHFYNTMYQRWLGPLSTDHVEPFQFLEIGYYNGKGFDAYSSFLPNAEKHSMEISCIEEGPQSEGKWPWGNFATKNPRYQELLDANRLHCGDASSFDFLNKTWTTQMKRGPDGTAPPLKVVIDDGSHLSEHMATSIFFWFPRLAPGGLLFIEDIEPQTPANAFRKNLLSQLMVDMHYCGLPEEKGTGGTKLCFPTIQPLLKSISCEMHICVLERNDQPAVEYNETASMPPVNALQSALCRG